MVGDGSDRVEGVSTRSAVRAAIVNRTNQATGVAVTSMSMIGLTAIYSVLWLLLFQALPRATTDPGASLPGATVVAVVLAALQTVTQFYLPHQVGSSSQLYGQIGVLVAFLGWFFFIGRAIAFAFALNAVVYEQVGSLSTVFFAVPVIREIPRRVPAVGRYFDLDHVTDGDRETPEGIDVPGVHRP